MTSMNNIEKLIQIATIEHMYSMLQKISNNTKDDSNINDESIKKYNYDDVISTLTGKVYDLEQKCQSKNYDNIIFTLTTKVNNLERELDEIKSNTNNNSRYLCQQIRGQQVLTSYPGFLNTSVSPIQSTKLIDEEHIRLKIEEKEKDDLEEEKDDLEEEKEKDEIEEE